MGVSEEPRAITDEGTSTEDEECFCWRCTTTRLSSPTTFHPWCRLPTELRMLVLEHALQESILRLRRTPRYHEWFVLGAWADFVNCNVRILDKILGTRNRELVELALDAREYDSIQNH